MWVLLLIAVIAASGCTGYTTYNKTNTSSDEENAFSDTPNITVKPGFVDLCSNVVCGLSKVKCPDGFVVACPNTCINDTGECTACIPSCAGHLARSCDNVQCGETAYNCPDGYTAKCQQSCYKGVCISCVPDCTGHYGDEEQSSQQGQQDLCAGKNCGSSSVICSDYYNATCSNTCSGGNCVACSPSCSGHELGHIMFSEVMYDTPIPNDKGEWIEIYNPLYIAVNLSNWTISDNTGIWRFPDLSLQPNSSIIITDDASAFINITNCQSNLGTLNLQLANTGDQLTLKDSNSADIDFVAWKKGDDGAYPLWNIKADGGNKTLRRISLTIDTNSTSDWQESPPQRC